MTAGPGGGRPEGGPWTDWASRAERAARELRAGRGEPDAHIRVSDAERSVVADQLSAHFAAGRLDQAEFDERMGQAMAAKTRGELPALLADLPPAVPPPPRQRAGRTLLLVALALVVAASLAATFSVPGPHLRLGWVPFAIVVLIVLRVRHRRRYPR